MSASPEPSRDESLVSKAPESDPRDDEVNNQLLNGYQVLDSVRIPIPRSSYLRQLEKAARNSTRTSSTTPEPEPEKKIAKTRKKMVGRRPARNKKKSKIEISVPLNQNVPYQVYACDWDGCQAELHNLTMLRKHVLKVHFSGPADDGDSGGGGVEMMRLSCKWEACSYSDASSRPELYTHVLNKHIEPLAWKLGDGPFVPWIDGNRPTLARPEYPDTSILQDSDQPVGEDSLIFPASYMSIRAFNRVHGNHSQQEKAREVLKAVQRLKDRIGVGLDPGGCKLATPPRIWNLEDEEEVFKFVRVER